MKTYGDEIDYNQTPIPPILKWVTPESKVLEFGSARGYMTRYMKEVLHCKVTCIELNGQMKSLLEPYAEKVIITDVDEGTWDKGLEGCFDYILFGDVLEHLRYPQETLRKASLLGRCILTSVPNIGHASILLSLLEGEFCYKQYGLLDDTHIHFFTRKSLEEMMYTVGFCSTEEQSNICLYPSRTELHKYYIKHLGCAFPIIRKPDSGVYQFVNKWERAEGPILKKTRSRKVNLLVSIKIILIDLACFLYDYFDIKSDFIYKIGLKLKRNVWSKDKDNYR